MKNILIAGWNICCRDNRNAIVRLFSILIFLFLGFICQSQNTNYDLARQYLQENRLEQAIPILEEEMNKNFNEEGYQLLYSAYTVQHDDKKLEKLIRRAIKKSNERYDYVIDLGNFYDRIGQKSKAEKQFNKVIDNLTTNNSGIVQVSNYFIHQGNYEYAAKTYKRGRELFNDDTKYIYELTYLYQLQGNNEQIAVEYINLLETNPELLSQIEVNINDLFSRDSNSSLFSIIKDFTLEKLKKEDHNTAFNQFYYWLLMQKGDYNAAFIQSKAISRRFNDGGLTVIDFADKAASAGRYSLAIDGYDYVLKNYSNEAIGFRAEEKRLSCFYNRYIDKVSPTSKDTKALKDEYAMFFHTNGYTPQSVHSMMEYVDLLAYHLGEAQSAVDILDSILNMRVDGLTKAQCKLKRADIYLINGDIWEASLTYSQVDKDMKNENIGSQAKYRNAMLSYYTGDFDWALSQFDILRSSTTKLIANDAMQQSLLIKENMDEDSSYNGLRLYAKADFLLLQNRVEEAQKYFDSIEYLYPAHPLMDEILYNRAEIAIKAKDYAKADSLLKQIILHYPTELMADDALMMLGNIALEHLGDKKKAKDYYEQIILNYPASLYVPEARKRYFDL